MLCIKYNILSNSQLIFWGFVPELGINDMFLMFNESYPQYYYVHCLLFLLDAMLFHHLSGFLNLCKFARSGFQASGYIDHT